MIDHTKWRTRKAVVIYTPWQGEPCIMSTHASLRAAETEARRCREAFRQSFPGSYGVSWEPAIIGPTDDIRAAIAKAECRS